MTTRSFIKCVQTSGFEDKEQIIVESPRPEFADVAVNLYSAAGSFRGAERLGRNVLLPMAPHFSKENIIEVLSAIKTNGQILYAAGSPDIIAGFLENTRRHVRDTKDAWLEFIATIPDDPSSDYYYSEVRKRLVSYGILHAA